MEKYIKYSFYDELGKKIVILDKNIDKDIMQKILQQYDEVRYEE